jgi:hypothetical protein
MAGPSRPDALTVVRRLDVVLLVIALPVFLAAGFPLGGYAAGAGAWLAQLAIATYTTRRAVAAQDVRTRVGLLAGSMILRGWLVALTILLVGLLAERRAGLSAAILFLAVLTVHMTTSMILRPFDAPAPGRSTDASPDPGDPKPGAGPDAGSRP